MKHCSECTFFYSEKSLCVRTQLAERVSKDGSCTRHTPKSSPNSCKYCTSGGYKFDYLGGVVIGVTKCQHCNVDGHKKPTDVMIAGFPSLFKGNAVSCGACNHYNPHISKCLNNNVMKQMRQANDWCSKYEPKQEEKQMKNLVNNVIEVKLDEDWHEINVEFRKGNMVYFRDPRPAVAPAVAPSLGANHANLKVINADNSNYFRESRFVNVVIDEKFNIVHHIAEDVAPHGAPMQIGHKLAKLVFQ